MALWRGRAGKIETAVTVAVPDTGMLKICEVEFYNNGKEPVEVETVYYTEPVLGVDRKNARFIKSRWQGGVLSLHSPWNTAVPGYMALTGGEGDGASVAVTGRIFGVENGGSSACFRLDDPAAAVGLLGFVYRQTKGKVRLCSPLPRRNRRQKRFWKLRRSGCFTMPSGGYA